MKWVLKPMVESSEVGLGEQEASDKAGNCVNSFNSKPYELEEQAMSNSVGSSGRLYQNLCFAQ